MKRLALILLSLTLVACSGDDSPQRIHQQIYVFGTLVDITIDGAERERAEAAISAIDADFQRMHREWHAWKPGPLSAANQAIAAGKSAVIPDSLIPIIEHSRGLETRSEGLFNPAIGGLLQLWGFQADTPPNGPPPSPESIARWVDSGPSMAQVHLDGNAISSSNPAVQLDFGAFAKGYAVDLAIERLQEMGIANAIVNAGGDLRAIGRAAGQRPWRVGVRHPQGKGVLAAIEVSGDEAVFTSGNYERYREHEGVRYMHILDPRSGMPVQGVTTVTVLHENGALADAAATALVVAGVEGWPHIAKRLGLKAAMLVDEEGIVHLTPAMHERLSFEGEPPTLDIVELD